MIFAEVFKPAPTVTDNHQWLSWATLWLWLKVWTRVNNYQHQTNHLMRFETCSMPTFEVVNVFHSVTSNRLKQPIQGRGFYWNQKCPRRPQVVLAYKGAVVVRHQHSARNNSTMQRYLTCAKMDKHSKRSGSRRHQIHSVTWHQKGAEAVFQVQVKTIAPGSKKKVYCQVCRNLPFLCLNSRPICAQKQAALLTF